MVASVSIMFGLGGVVPEGQVPAAHAGVGQPIRLSPSNGHYFDFRGAPTGLASGTHTLKIVVTGAKNPSSSGYYQSADAFEYFH